MTFFRPGEPVHVELWDKQTLTDTGVRLEFPAGVIAVNVERGWLIGALPNELYVFDIDTGELIAQREGFVHFSWEADFSSDGTRLITYDRQGNATLWDTETWEHVMDFRPSDGNGLGAAKFAPSSELVTVDPAGTIVVRNSETLEPPMIGEPETFILGFSRDGTRLLSANAETILWDLATRTRIADGFPGAVPWPGLDSADRAVSKPLLSDGNILIWNLNTDEWYDIACRAAGRNMTRTEWEEFGPQDDEYQATCPQFPLEPETGS